MSPWSWTSASVHRFWTRKPTAAGLRPSRVSNQRKLLQHPVLRPRFELHGGAHRPTRGGSAVRGAAALILSTREPNTRVLALNPEGEVPTLVVNGRPLTEVAAILFYLARRFPEAGLLPPDPEGEAHALSWMSFIAATLHPARRRGLEHATSVYRLADQRMAGSGWVLGAYSVADIHLFRLFWRLNASLQPSPNTFPNLLAHHDRMLARPAVRRTIEVEAEIGYELPA